jgi:hypothetical protein
MVIIANPTSKDDQSNDYAIDIAYGIENVVIRNVVVYHAANGMGISALNNKNLRIENVEVFAYGNDWGAQPCPTRAPFKGSNCNNIKIANA